MTKFVNAVRDIFNKYTFLSPVLFLCGTVAILWLNTQYVTKSEFSEHLVNEKQMITEFQKNNDVTHKEIIATGDVTHKELMGKFAEFDKKLDSLLIGNATTLKQFEFISLLQKKQDDEIVDLKGRMIFLERQKNVSRSP